MCQPLSWVAPAAPTDVEVHSAFHTPALDLTAATAPKTSSSARKGDNPVCADRKCRTQSAPQSSCPLRLSRLWKFCAFPARTAYILNPESLLQLLTECLFVQVSEDLSAACHEVLNGQLGGLQDLLSRELQVDLLLLWVVDLLCGCQHQMSLGC